MSHEHPLLAIILMVLSHCYPQQVISIIIITSRFVHSLRAQQAAFLRRSTTHQRSIHYSGYLLASLSSWGLIGSRRLTSRANAIPEAGIKSGVSSSSSSTLPNKKERKKRIRKTMIAPPVATAAANELKRPAALTGDNHSNEPPTPTPVSAATAAAVELPPSKKLKRLRSTDPAAAERFEYRTRLGLCYKDSNVDGAISLFREIREKKATVAGDGFNILLSLCGLYNRHVEMDEIFQYMREIKAPLNEAAYASVIRSKASSGAVEEAKGLLHQMLAEGQKARLRSYTSILLAYSSQGQLEDAFALYDHMLAAGIAPTEVEYAAMLRVSTIGSKEGGGDAKRFFRILEEMRENIMVLEEETMEALKAWFEGQQSRGGGPASSSSSSSPAAVIASNAMVDPQGKCSACGDILQSIELSHEAAQSLLQQVEEIVLAEASRLEEWTRFKASLAEGGHHSQYDVVIDGANVGYFQMNFADAPTHVNYQQIDWVVDHFLKWKQRPLLVLHARHVTYGKVPREFVSYVKKWSEAGILLTVPFRNNDDWFWLYATVVKGGRTLIVTNDEMRDHHFQMLSDRSFLRWKERHQAYFSFGPYHRDRRSVLIEAPAVFSRCIQKGSSSSSSSSYAGWHFPHAQGHEWLCVQNGQVSPSSS